jgi:hypothetical protein
MSDINANNIIAAGTIVAGLGLTAQSVNAPGPVASGSLSAVGPITGQSLNVPGLVSAGTLAAVGGITGQSLNVPGLVSSGYLNVGLNASIGGTLTVSGPTIYNGPITYTGPITGPSISVSGAVSAASANVAGALTVPNTGSFNLAGLNAYEGAIQSGDIISVNQLGVVSAAQTNAYMAALIGPAGASTFWQDTSYNIVINQIVYWGNDFLTNSVDKFSATLLVPYLGSNVYIPTGLPKNSAIVSYKHGTLSSVYQNTTLWAAMQEAAAGQVYSTSSIPVDPAAWMFSATGYITVCADNVSYGKSVGSYDYQNVSDEATSQYAAIVATTQLMTMRPSLFYGQFVGVSPVNVINSGYSLGGVQCVYIAQLIKNIDIRNPYANTNTNSIPLKLVQTIAGAPLNAYQLLTSVLETNYNSPTLWTILLLVLLSLGDPQNNGIKQSVRPNILTDVYPTLNQFYANTNTTSVSQLGNLQAATFNSVGNAFLLQNPGNVQSISVPTPGAGNTFPIDASNNYTIATTGYITPNQFYKNPYYTDCSAHNFALNSTNQVAFYTNRFVDYTDLSGTPISVIYSTGDELACNNAGAPAVYNDTSQNIYVGIPAKDTIYDAYKAWNDSSNSTPTFPSGIRSQGKLWVDVSGGFALGGYTTTNPATNPIATVLLSTENTNTSSVVRVNKDDITPGQNLALQHSPFLITVFQLGVRVYLNSRT